MSDIKEALLKSYLSELSTIALKGDAREESFYGALSGMLAGVAESGGRDYVRVTTLPAKMEGGNPDFRLWNGTDRIIGYVEAKKPTEEDLSRSRNPNNSGATAPRFPTSS